MTQPSSPAEDSPDGRTPPAPEVDQPDGGDGTSGRTPSAPDQAEGEDDATAS